MSISLNNRSVEQLYYKAGYCRTYSSCAHCNPIQFAAMLNHVAQSYVTLCRVLRDVASYVAWCCAILKSDYNIRILSQYSDTISIFGYNLNIRIQLQYWISMCTTCVEVKHPPLRQPSLSVRSGSHSARESVEPHRGLPRTRNLTMSPRCLPDAVRA
jgi:hypothetical protein